MMKDGGFGNGKGLGRDNRELHRGKARLRKVVQAAVVAGVMVVLAAAASWSVVSDLLTH
jgi:hypothetical protein